MFQNALDISLLHVDRQKPSRYTIPIVHDPKPEEEEVAVIDLRKSCTMRSSDQRCHEVNDRISGKRPVSKRRSWSTAGFQTVSPRRRHYLARAEIVLFPNST